MAWRGGADGAVLLIAAALSLPARSASADPPPTKEQCIDANTRGQDLRRAGKLSAAREQLRTCAVPACPALLRDDCTRRLDEIDKVQPTVVFMVKDAAGKDVSAVKVTMDGRPLADVLDGTELPVDPGRHVFTFAAAGQAPVTATLVLAAGEKDRQEHVSLKGGAPLAAASEPSAAAPAVAQGAHLVVASDASATVSIDGKAVGTGRFDGRLGPGPHEVSIARSGMQPYEAEVDLREGETRTLDVTLEPEHHAAVWPWIAGGVAIAAGAAIGGYFLFKPSDTVTPVPAGSLPTAMLAAWKPR
jgi:hypothetical protein